MSAAQIRAVAITQAISIVADAAHAGKPLGEQSDPLIQLLEYLRAEEQALPDLHVRVVPTAEEYHRGVAKRLAQELEITANALRDSETKLAAAHWEIEKHRQNDRTQPAMGMDGEEPVTLAGLAAGANTQPRALTCTEQQFIDTVLEPNGTPIGQTKLEWFKACGAVFAEEPVTPTGMTLPHRATNIEVRP